jgi:proteasome accessory factor A
MFEIGHLVKPLYALAWLDWRGVARLFRRRQRLQIGLSDSNMCQAVALKGGGSATALDLQRELQRRAAALVAAAETPSLEARRVVDRWGEVLDLLEHDRDVLVGRIDWITKLRLLDETTSLSADARKKIDLRYHELGTGYHGWLEEAGIARVLVDSDVARRAQHEPPRGTPAERRGGLVRALAEAGVDARVGWQSVKIGRGTTIRLVEGP